MFSFSISARMWISFSMSPIATPLLDVSTLFFLMYLTSKYHQQRFLSNQINLKYQEQKWSANSISKNNQQHPPLRLPHPFLLDVHWIINVIVFIITFTFSSLHHTPTYLAAYSVLVLRSTTRCTTANWPLQIETSFREKHTNKRGISKYMNSSPRDEL